MNVKTNTPPLGNERIRKAWGQGLDADQNFFPETEPAALAREYAREFDRHITHVKIIPGAREAVTGLARVGLSLAVVTNSPLAIAEARPSKPAAC